MKSQSFYCIKQIVSKYIERLLHLTRNLNFEKIYIFLKNQEFFPVHPVYKCLKNFKAVNYQGMNLFLYLSMVLAILNMQTF